MKARHIPNIISVFRIILVYPVVHFLLARRFDWALALFVVAGVSDALDGFLAKHFNWQSRLGSYLDPLADKLLLVSCFLGAGWLGLIPIWLVVAVLLRDLVIVTGAIAYYFLLRPFEGRPHLTSKLNTFFQLVLIVAVLFHQGVAALPASLLSFLIAVVLITTLISGAIYVYVWGRSYWRETHPHP
ncbi:MAG TPA: CDP-alcohol phosphatidyltransferase family protein [Methylococcaceae bacterium]|nr:CDP-alcohol phosphatidyltransferase family protein [Methylococcaceae bacterium]